MTSSTEGISAIVPAFDKARLAIDTLRRIYACEPPPDEVIVHVDANQRSCAKEIQNAFPNMTIIVTNDHVGPGGSRNRLIEACRHELVASFDDDSYPIDRDYFKRAQSIAEQFPDAAIVCGAVYHRGEVVEQDARSAYWTADFSAGACIYRRKAFLEAGGYVPLPFAYGMEEVDLALRLHARGGKILTTSWLRVFHDTDLNKHADPTVTANSIANVALLTYLRYPASLWWVGLGQCMNRVLWLLRHRRWRGIGRGLVMIPSHLKNHDEYKMRVSGDRLKSYLSLRRRPLPQSL